MIGGRRATLAVALVGFGLLLVFAAGVKKGVDYPGYLTPGNYETTTTYDYNGVAQTETHYQIGYFVPGLAGAKYGGNDIRVLIVLFPSAAMAGWALLRRSGPQPPERVVRWAAVGLGIAAAIALSNRSGMLAAVLGAATWATWRARPVATPPARSPGAAAA